MVISVTGDVKPDKIIELEHRLLHQLIVGKSKSSALADELYADLSVESNKLEIEREAVRARMRELHRSEALYKAVSTQLTASINKDLEYQLSSAHLVLEHSNLNAKQILLLDTLYSAQVDLAKIRPLVAQLPWLQRDLINIINSPKFRHRRPKFADVQVTDLKLVLNYIGIENLQALIPYFCLRHLMPSGQSKLMWVTQKLWRYSIVNTIATQALAQLHEQDSAFFYSCSLMSQLGNTCVIGHCAKAFDTTWGMWLKEASASRDKTIYDAVMATELPAMDVYQQVLTQSRSLNWQLLELLNFPQSRLTKTYKSIDTSLTYADLTDDAKLLARANCFSHVYLLQEAGNITAEERRFMYHYYQFTEQELIRLKAQNYRKMSLI
ncbi:HDOD domain-containing protein [Shewanella sp.]|nr:HDOD domain-containing protein [Shewanella sp.]